jgi:predicted RNA-binding Zn-ribbon protein involved in translation (DUF1610 family)
MKHNYPRGTWGLRQLIRLLTLALAVLFFWLLGFVVDDIESAPGPDFATVERQYVSAELTERQQKVENELAELQREIEGKQRRRELAGDTSENLQRTINQLLELQRLSIEKSVAMSEAEKENLSASLKQFLAAQAGYQELNQAIGDLTGRKLALEDKLRQIERQIGEQRKPAQEQYNRLWEAHRLRLAGYQLAVLLPLLVLSGVLWITRRGGIYNPLLAAVGGATLLKVALVMHEYFPSRYFKYVLIGALMLIVAWLLVRLIRAVAFPQRQWLERQFREAYERFLCPRCEYPIRTGPRRFLYWTRRTVHKVLPGAASVAEETPYICPNCGTSVYETCPACGKLRHALLPHCEHCGAEKTPAELPAE